mgnify:FL=1
MACTTYWSFCSQTKVNIIGPYQRLNETVYRQEIEKDANLMSNVDCKMLLHADQKINFLIGSIRYKSTECRKIEAWPISIA